jgi:hypothetical protein
VEPARRVVREEPAPFVDRRDPEEEREVRRAAADRLKDLARDQPPHPDPKLPKADDPAQLEKHADEWLRSARLFLREGKKDAAHKWLKRIVKDAPESHAAEEARRLLKDE